MHFTPIGDLADVEPVLEQMGQRSDAKADTAALAATATAIDLGLYALPIELREHDFELLVDAAIAERNGSADPSDPNKHEITRIRLFPSRCYLTLT